ncbi:tRNA pseudouridine(55) synthase TruB [Candidatus Peregrinibacteria bacterium]|jgi:tRNA pseudouridine55 synthase|nr:tRNA pseudouridine(55) synthase TruB [Candidatus Peregrinibacteria bacterium]MBT4148125.1 tRNA pseudouridine(55) synthase TruB [Candidatus Peregrinibacteria bacterium]MBT4366731.1 tRNA pseudouridine(55) synthase TruB [Candidatus Peregrinibacteria bacterium]MBT4455698.1 tRNA pseudouridine(55) synthase TruB [Candidatus Peregrinibacteria bacterium]
MDGFLFIDKEKGITSFDVIRQLKRTGLIGKKKIGHAGTLDPIATGLMIIALGEGTKLLEFLIGADKVYRASCKFGEVSDTYDGDGEVVPYSESYVKEISREKVEKVFEDNFLGKISQIPPKYSAKKIDGKRAYDLAREGKEFEMKAREVNMYDFKIISFDWPLFEFEISCSSGTYVRSIVHDLGQMLECGAYMTDLRRTEIGFLAGGKSRGISVDDAVKVGEVSDLDEIIHVPEELFDGYPFCEINMNDYSRLKNGGFTLNTKSIQTNDILAFCGGKIVGVLEPTMKNKFVKFRKQIKLSP